MERRAHVASVDPDARTRLLFGDAADARIIDAVLAEPPELSGLPRDRYDNLLGRRLRQLHGAEMDALEKDEESVAAAEAAIAVAKSDMKRAFGPKSDGLEFDKTMNQATMPWLIDRGGGSVAVVKIDANGQATYPEASELEKRTGKFFKDLDEYKAQAA